MLHLGVATISGVRDYPIPLGEYCITQLPMTPSTILDFVRDRGFEPLKSLAPKASAINRTTLIPYDVQSYGS